MDLSQMPALIDKSKKRVGRGIGSGKGGHTSGRGQKGQKARNKVPVYFMGAAAGASLIKRLPYLRGKGKMKFHGTKDFPVNVQLLNVMPKGTEVTIESLVKHNVITDDIKNVKILGGGKLEVSLTVALPVSKEAQTKIEKAGGSVGTKAEKPAQKEKKEAKKTK